MTAQASLSDDVSQSDYVFVYGALMRGLELHHYLAGAVFVDTGWTRGQLLTLGRYPALVAGTDQVSGELYRLADAPAALEALDDVEEFDPADPERSLYLRIRADIHKSDGSVVAAWLYRYNKETAGAAVITSGDWRSFQQR